MQRMSPELHRLRNQLLMKPFDFSNPGWVAAVSAIGISWPSALIDWKKRLSATINGAAKTPDFVDTIDTTGDWTKVGTLVTADDHTAGKISYNAAPGGADHRVYQDMGVIDDDVWVFDLDIDTMVASVANTNFEGFYITESTAEPTASAATKMVGIRINSGNPATILNYYLVVGNGTTQAAVDTGIDYVSGEYIRITKRYGIIIFETFSDAARTRLRSRYISSHANNPDAIGLQYLHFGAQSGEGGGVNLTSLMDNPTIWSGKSAVENIPSQQTPEIDDDFVSYADQTAADAAFPTSDNTKVKVNPTTDKLEYTFARSPLDTEYLSHDITGAVVGDKWVLKLHDLQITTSNMGQVSFIGLSSSATGLSSTTQDACTIQIGSNTGTLGTALETADGGALSRIASLYELTVDTLYDIDLIRDGDLLTQNVYLKSNGKLVFTETISGISAIANLRYFKVTSDTASGSTENITVEIARIEFYENLTEVNPATLTEYPLAVSIQDNVDLQRKTAETAEDLFTVDNFDHVDSGQTSVNTTTNKFVSNGIQDTSNNAATDDPNGAIFSDTIWRMDFEITPTVLTESSTTTLRHCWGLWENDRLTDGGTAQDFAGLFLFGNNTKSEYRIVVGNNSHLDTSAITTTFTVAIPEVGRTNYIVMLRNGDDFTINIYADKAHTVLLESQTRNTASVANLRYVGFKNYEGTSQSNIFAFELQKLRIWDGILNPVDKEIATFDYDFASDPGVVTNGGAGETDYDAVGDHWNAKVTFDGTDQNAHIDLGDGVLDEQRWRMDYDIDISAEPMPGSGASKYYFFGLSSHDKDTDYVSNQDSVALMLNKSNDYKMVTGNDQSMAAVQTTLNRTIAVEHLYVILTRDSDTFRTRLYSDAAHTNLLEDESVVKTGVSGLRYLVIKHQHYDDSSSVVDAAIDNIMLWNGTTSSDASGRKLVFTNNDVTDSAIEYASKMKSYDPINGDWFGDVKIPALGAGVQTELKCYFDYQATNPIFIPEIVPEDGFTPFTDDFTTLVSRGETGTLYTFDTATDERIEGTFSPNASVNAATLDLEELLGEPINPKHWRLRFKYEVLTQSVSTTAEAYSFVGLASIDHTVGGATVSDSAMFCHRINQAGSDFRFYTVMGNNIAHVSGTLNLMDSAVTVKAYWVEMIRDGDDVTFTTYSDSTYETVDQTQVETEADVDGLKYFRCSNHNNGASWNGSGTFAVDDLEFINGFGAPREQSVHTIFYKAVHDLNGNALDSTVYANHGTETNVVYEQQADKLGIVADGANTKIDAGSEVVLDNVFIGGASVKFTINPDSDGEGSAGRIIGKVGWYADTIGESSGFMKLRFTQIMSGNNGQWETGVIIPVGSLTNVEIIYNNDDVANNPIFIINGVRLTVGNGITETTAPTASVTSDAASSLIIGNDTTQVTTFDGFITSTKLLDKMNSSSEAIASHNAETEDSDMITIGATESQ